MIIPIPTVNWCGGSLKVHFSHFAIPCWGHREGDRAHMTYDSGWRSLTSANNAVLYHPASFTGAARRLLIGQHVRKPTACWGAELQLLPSRSDKSSSKVQPLLPPPRYVGARWSFSPWFVFSLYSCLIDLPLPVSCWLKFRFNGAYRTDERPSRARPGHDTL